MDEKPQTVTFNPSNSRQRRQVTLNLLWLLPLLIIVLCAASFYGGVAYQKVKNTPSASATSSMGGADLGQNGFGGGGFNGERPNIGDVTAVSSTSITIQNQRSGSSQTFTIDSSTTVTDNGASASVSSIQTGDTVLIRTSSSSSTTASSIDINPSFGGAQPGDGSTSDNSASN